MKIKLKNPIEFKKLLILKGLSQRSLGRMINISEPYANQIANGEKNPGPRVAKSIVDALEIKFDDIFFID